MQRISDYAARAALGVALAAGLSAVAAPSTFGADVQYTQVQRDDMPKPVRHEADAQARDGKDVQYQKQSRDGKTFYSVHWTAADGKRMEVRLDEAGKVADGPHAARESSDKRQGDTAADNDDRGVKFHGISAKDVKREVPADVLKTMDQQTQGGSDPFYQRQVRQDGKTYYSVHYTKDGKRMFVRTDDKGKIALGPQESKSTTVNRANPEIAKAPAGKANVEVKRETINGELLPQPVRKTIEQTMANGGGHVFHKETRGDEVTYVVDYTVGEQQTSARVAADGKVLEASPLANVQPGQAQPPVAAPQQPAESEAQLAAARESAQREAEAAAASAAAAAGPYQLLTGANQLPAEARTAVEQSIEAGSTDLLIQRYGRENQNVYSVHFTTPNGQRHFMAVDQAGKVVIPARKSNAQEGGKGVRFEAITGDQLPPEVRKEVETNGGSGHLFLARTEPDGQKTYLVQYTGPKGDRLESRFNANGKEVGKPRAAREQPFTILDRKGD